MVLYECYNCGYNHTDKSKLVSHFNRKTKCKSIRDDINLDECKKYILEGIQYDEYNENIDNIEYPDTSLIYSYLSNLAYNQFTERELRNGTAWRIVNESN